MSKASDFANRTNKRPEFSVKHTPTAYVDDGGNLFIYMKTIDPIEALKFALWIIDTFGEESDGTVPFGLKIERD